MAETLSLDTQERAGGLAAWAPSITPPIGVDLTDEQTLACAFRILAADGFSENIAGHITWQRPGDDTMLVNPWGLWWSEVSASDVCAVSATGEVVAGKWDVTPAIHIHTSLHKVRPDARVVIHNHPYHACVLAAIGVLPEIVHQTGAMFQDELGFVDEYTGEIDSADLGDDLAARIGPASVVVLASHGVIVTAPTVAEAVYKAQAFERACRLFHDILRLGREPLPLAPGLVKGMKASLLERGAPVYWAGAVRQLIAADPGVLA